VEVESGPRLPDQGRARPLAVPRVPGRRGRRVLRRDGTDPADPHQGPGWAERKRPERHRETYGKNGGVRYPFGARDVHADRLHGRMRPHKSGQEILAFYRLIRMRYRPKIRIYLIADNLFAHKTPDVRDWAENNNVELVFTPTYASFPNRIECHFWAIGEFVVNNADYPDWNFRKFVATSGEKKWPPLGKFVAANGENSMAIDTRGRTGRTKTVRGLGSQLNRTRESPTRKHHRGGAMLAGARCRRPSGRPRKPSTAAQTRSWTDSSTRLMSRAARRVTCRASRSTSFARRSRPAGALLQPNIHPLKRTALAFSISADLLLFDEGERGPSDDLKLQFEATHRLHDEEKTAVKRVLEGLVLAYEARRCAA